MSGWSIRLGRPDEGDLVGRCVYLALGWSPDRELPAQEVVLAHPEVTRYHADWGRPGDILVVAESEGVPVGYAFARRFSEEDHGHGFVAEETPEMGIAVEDGHRGSGMGAALMTFLHETLRSEGTAAVSLSVELANPAKRLYERLGYRLVREDDDAAIMVLEL